ncbi:MAG: CvpA family protein [Clostridiales bacterium]|nr:CvpA family protein [Clostridiales bacterium]
MENFDISSLEISGFTMNGVIIDIIIALVIIFSAIYGYYKGFIRSAIGIVSFGVSFVCAWVFTPFLSPVIYGGFMLRLVRGAVNKAIEVAGISGLRIDTTSGALPDSLARILSRFGVKAGDFRYSGALSADAAADAIAEGTADILSKAAAFLIIFFGAALLLHIIGIIIEKAVKLTGLSGVNRFFGGLLGIVCGVFYAMLIAAVMRGVWPSLCAAWPDIFAADALSGSFLLSLTEKISIGLIAERILGLTKG